MILRVLHLGCVNSCHTATTGGFGLDNTVFLCKLLLTTPNNSIHVRRISVQSYYACFHHELLASSFLKLKGAGCFVGYAWGVPTRETTPRHASAGQLVRFEVT